MQEYRKKNYGKCKEAKRKQSQRYREKHPEKIKEQKRRNYLRNKAYYIEKAKKRWVNSRKAPGVYDHRKVLLRFELYGNICAYCGIEGKMTQDHVVSVYNGGSNYPANFVPSCMRCNASKREKFWKPNLPKSGYSDWFNKHFLRESGRGACQGYSPRDEIASLAHK